MSDVQTSVSAWRSKSGIKGAQVVLVIERRDLVINLCEIKYSIHPFTIDKKVCGKLRDKTGGLKSETNTRKSVFQTMINTFGVMSNSYSTGIIRNDFNMDILFAEI